MSLHNYGRSLAAGTWIIEGAPGRATALSAPRRRAALPGRLTLPLSLDGDHSVNRLHRRELCCTVFADTREQRHLRRLMLRRLHLRPKVSRELLAGGAGDTSRVPVLRAKTKVGRHNDAEEELKNMFTSSKVQMQCRRPFSHDEKKVGGGKGGWVSGEEGNFFFFVQTVSQPFQTEKPTIFCCLSTILSFRLVVYLSCKHLSTRFGTLFFSR